ncbi:hypothetical protein ACJMK2_029971 [Sinanodonta woodiana]|uniref:Phospholipid/glycerol acyltransferase domain-containing protein n=1 Tax=Sinanodonta woodiana TaxID=1069815 RepID=A0ABD3XCC9_SINWO
MAGTFVQQIKGFALMSFILCYIFLTSGLIVNFLLLCNLIVRRINFDLYRKINYYLVSNIWYQFTFVAQWWSGSDCILYMDPEDRRHVGREHSMYICNHIYEIDWLMTWIIAQRYDVAGNTKVYAKSILKYVPILGWAWYFSETIFLKRNWEQDKVILSKSINDISTYPDGFWVTLLLFPEGTRRTPEKHKQSQEIAKEKGYPILKHHLLPRTKGFALSVQHMKGKIPAVYDCTVAFPPNEPEPTLMDVIKGRKVLGHLRVKRYETDTLPDGEEELGNWLRQVYKEKDDALDQFYKTGKFDLPAVRVPKNAKDLVSFIFWSLLTCIPLFYYLTVLFLAGTIYQQMFFIAVVVIATFIVRWMIGFTEIKKSSSEYGQVQKKKE